MQAVNTEASYGSLARAFHWLTALLILTVFPLGLYAENLPYANSEELAFKAQMFSIHKTLGIATFFVALARILWALSQKHPAPLHPERRLETFAAEAVHYALYLALIIVPLSGWIGHAATSGFAPILWPFGDDLPLVPKSPLVEAVAAGVHVTAIWVLAAALFLHIAGALKHALIDRDATLARMVSGVKAGTPAPGHSSQLAKLAALAVYLLVIGYAWQLAQQPEAAPSALAEAGSEAGAEAQPAPPAATTGSAASESAANWQVESGTLGFTVQQMGAAVQGSFPDWSAEILFNETADASGEYGRVTVEINTATLVLGSVSDQAKGADFFNTASFPVAIFTAPIKAADEGYIAEGVLQLRGTEKPVSLPFTLEISGDTAVMKGEAVLDRRDFGMGESYQDEASVGFSVIVTTGLTAKRKD
ncbi:cytochrome b/b6 domain-containing protein [Pseudogemmobacter faecipullorum]|uniref:Cytochrome b/b6 domain-containing protein n=1 Tax=Pseudogemmobacter faecipullorum TaxID=2755041 RepID=A0ABS8CKT3_9RHOB|nr:cytochrome b/b6 domain-containing protein [Pseudogemmobacter faecipullorum]MCB5409999.1 cytochrome b/b6 domain-containing protein [Pseudogemmobacter faecipullorum]